MVNKERFFKLPNNTLSTLQSQLVAVTGKAKLNTTKSSLKKQISESNLMRL